MTVFEATLTSREDAIKAVREHVREQPKNNPDSEFLWLTSRVGLVLTRYGVSASPGGYALAHWYDNKILMLGLDFAFDMSDEHTTLLRDIVFTAMEEAGVDFIPMSYNALGRLSLGPDTIELVDRVGRQCVFSGRQRFFNRETGQWDTSVTDLQYYISGFDANEDPPLYFLARLPYQVESYKDAIEALKPESVKLAEAKGLEVLRQGDMFAIPTKYSTSDLKKLDAVFQEYQDDIYAPRPWGSLYGTAHCTEKMARLPDGTQLGRGVMMHRPHGREPDHRDLSLSPAKWYLIVKNTVPTTDSERR